ncbi:iron-containing redox enzyme family protein [Aeromicrobium halocynthiae]|uniref:Iron-containing redox enzyme family protein n=2 Tax=Aeromicrobium halocynthiae TaxID=560557 RepID=A0ABN2W959_9ACTN
MRDRGADGYVPAMKLPDARGPLGAAVLDHLRGHRSLAEAGVRLQEAGAGDRALTLWTLHELYFRGFDDVDADMEWDPTVVGLRNELESDLESDLRRAFEAWDGPMDLPGMIAAFEDRPGLSTFIRTSATAAQVREILAEKSVFHLKEADPHAFVQPRLDVAPKAALATIQFDELGAGRPDRLHAKLFADTLDAAGLDPTYGAYVARVATSTLTVSNVLTMFCLRRRLRFAAAGHLAAFEATSSLPCAAIVRGLRRLGFDERVVTYYDEHVEADAVHEALAWEELCVPMIDGDADREREVLFGAFACMEVEARNAADLLERWT